MDISLPKRCLICASLLPMRGSLRSLCSLSTFLRSAGTAAPLRSAWLPLPQPRQPLGYLRFAGGANAFRRLMAGKTFAKALMKVAG